MNKKTKKILAGVAIAFGMIVLGFGLRSSSLLDQFEKKLTHGLYETRDLGSDIMIVRIDDQSMKDPEDGGLGLYFDWSREYYAKVIENVREAGARSVFLDLLFLNQSQSISFPEIANIVNESGDFDEVGRKVGAYLSETPAGDFALSEALDKDVFLLARPVPDAALDGNVLKTESKQGAIELFSSKSNDVLGTLAMDGNEQAVYAMPVGFEIGGKFEESLSVKLARDYLYGGLDSEGGFSADGKSYEFDSIRKIPLMNGQFLINYATKSLGFPSVSFMNVYKGNFDSSDMKGKIVMIGAYSPVLQDNFPTPIDANVQMPGVEVQANAIQTVIDDAFLRTMSGSEFLILLGVLTGLSVVLFLYLPVLAGSGIFAIELIGFPFFAQYMFRRGIILDLIWPVFTIFISYIVVLAYRNMTEFREKREIKNAFSKYVSGDLVKEIMDNPKMLKLGGERREITVMFLDIENFTSLSESLPSQEVAQLLNTYFDAFANVIKEHSGTVDKFEGDAIMALFGAPVPYAEHATKACLCAIELCAKLAEVNKVTGQTLNIRIGIATGQAIVGNMGSIDRFDYTAIGDIVNTASRLEGGNKFYGSRILVNPKTSESAQNSICFRRLDKVRLKGKMEAIDVFEIFGKVEDISNDMKVLLGEWHQALEYYRNQNWNEVEFRLKKVLESLPEDGPSKTYLQRVAYLRENPVTGFDGTWSFDQK